MYSLANYAYCCEFSDGAVILDLRRDAYMAVNAALLQPLRRIVRNWPARDEVPAASDVADDEVDVDSVVASLVSRGILSASATPSRIELGSVAPVTSAVSATADFTEGVGIVEIARFLASLITVVFLRRRGLVPLVNWLREAQSSLYPHWPSPPESSIALVKSFLRLRLFFYTAYGRCLFDSQVLSVYLTKAKVPCIFVIGVSTKPFLAHAWVQIGETVLNDTAENVQLYTPIFSICEPA